MENFLLPSKVELQPGSGPLVGEAIISPCYHGYGTTLGNALRRVLLSSLPGAAVEYFKIKGVQHEFSTVEGVQEDVVELMLNLKQLAVRVFSEEPVTLSLSKNGPGMVTAGDIAPNSSVEIVNTDLVLATLMKNKTLEMEITVGRGRGYRPVEEKNRQNYDLGTIVVDSVYTPVRDVGYKVEYTRVGDITNYEKLTLSIETNGTISPAEALRQSTQILIDHFSIILTAATGAAETAEAALRASQETPPVSEAETSSEKTAETSEDTTKEKKTKSRAKKTTKKK